MTCIVGLVEDGRVFLGGDSSVTSGWDQNILSTPKVFRNGPMVMGATGTLRTLQLLQHALVIPEHPDDMTIERYLATTFVNAVRECFKSAGYAEKEKDAEQYSGRFLVGYRGCLASIGGDYGVRITETSYQAAGIGDSFALGVFYATEGMAPRRRIQLALEASERFCAGVRGPFHVEVLEALAAASAA